MIKYGCINIIKDDFLVVRDDSITLISDGNNDADLHVVEGVLHCHNGTEIEISTGAHRSMIDTLEYQHIQELDDALMVFGICIARH